jgi:hypothetical protein
VLIDRGHEELPVAVEVELTIKAPRRLTSICRAWARSRSVVGTVYLAAPRVLPPLERAIEAAHAQERVVALELDAIADLDRSQRTVAARP